MRQTVNDVLAAYIPVDAVEAVSHILETHSIHLRITRNRLTKLGDYKPGRNGSPHQISVNGDLNIYEFLLVFLHELAHLKVYERHGRKVAPHGREWKEEYGAMIRRFTGAGLFHPSVCGLLVDYSYRVKASGVAVVDVARALRAFDKDQKPPAWLFLDEIKDTGVFQTRNGRMFRKEEKVRTRFRCLCLDNKKRYLIHAAAKVKPLHLIDG